MKVLITGANGYIGSQLATALARNHEVTGLVRKTPESEANQMSLCVCSDICDVSARDFADVDVVIHAAGIAEVGSDGAELHRVNVEGSHAVALACREAGVRQLIHLSSAKACGEGSVGPKVHCEPESSYGRSKQGAEQAIDAAIGAVGTHVCHLRFPLVYGPGVTNNFKTLVSLAGSRWPLPLGALSARRSYCALENLTELIITMIDTPAETGVFYVADAAPIKLPQLLRAIGLQIDHVPTLMKVPEVLLKNAVRMLRPANYAQLFNDAAVDVSETESAFPDWNPKQTEDRLGFLKEFGRDGRI